MAYVTGYFGAYLRGYTGATTGGDLFARRIYFYFYSRYYFGGTNSYATSARYVYGYRVLDLAYDVLLGDGRTECALAGLVL